MENSVLSQMRITSTKNYSKLSINLETYKFRNSAPGVKLFCMYHYAVLVTQNNIDSITIYDGSNNLKMYELSELTLKKTMEIQMCSKRAPQASKIESFETIFNDFQPFSITAKLSILDVFGGPSYSSGALRSTKSITNPVDTRRRFNV